MPGVRGNLHRLQETHLAGVGLGVPADLEVLKAAPQRSHNLLAAGKLIDLLDAADLPPTQHEEAFGAKHMGIAVVSRRIASAGIPAGLAEDVPAQTVRFLETRTNLYRRLYPLGLHRLRPLLKAHEVTMAFSLEDDVATSITLRGVNRAIPFGEVPGKDDLDRFGMMIELAAQAEGLEEQMAARGLLWSRQMNGAAP